MKKHGLPCLLIAAIALAQLPKTAEDWVFVKEKNGIKVWHKKESGGGVHAFKSEQTLACNLSGIVKLFRETENYPKWGYQCVEARIVRSVSETDFFYYARYDFPWPISDRDCVMRSQMWQDPDTRKVIFDIVCAADELPEKRGVVRLRTAFAHWTLNPLGGGKTQALHLVRTDPGGRIPTWIANLAADEGLFNTSAALQRILETGGYSNVRLPSVLD